MRLRGFYMAEGDAPAGGEVKPPPPVEPVKPPATAGELKALEAEAKKIEAQVSKGEISSMSESTAHAILENLKELRKEIKEARAHRGRGFFGF